MKKVIICKLYISNKFNFLKYRIFDANKLPHDSRKLQCLIDNLSCVIYTIDTTNYQDEMFFEEELNQIIEYRNLLADVPFMLCFNMMDLMDGYLKKFPYFDYSIDEFEEEEDDEEEIEIEEKIEEISVDIVMKKIISKFKILTTDRVYIHKICSLDDEDVSDLFDCVHQILSRPIESCNCTDKQSTHDWMENSNFYDISIFTFDSRKEE